MAKKKKRRRIRGLVALLAVITFSAVAIILGPDLKGLYDKNSLDYQRLWRRALIQTGHPLPGTPDLGRFNDRLAAAGHKLGDAIFMRIFKQEFELEIWMQRNGIFHHFATYPICRWSGVLGPKLKQGDRQAPEGIYTVATNQLNPNSRWHRSFNLGFPNIYDRLHSRTGTFLMVHGGCSSAGCYAMTNPVIDEIWALVTAALANGQKRFQVQAFPFRLSQERLAQSANHPDAALWQDLKIAHDLFLETRIPPRAAVCKGRYVFKAATKGYKGTVELQKTCAGFPTLAKS